MKNRKYVLVLNILIFLTSAYSNDNDDKSFSNEWLVDADLSESEARDLADTHGLSFLKKLPTGHLLFKMNTLPKRSKTKGKYAFERHLKNDKRVRSVQQQQWKQVSLRQYLPSISDSKWSEMWYLRKSDAPSLGVLPNWQFNYTGRRVTIAIVDDGVEHSHPDLTDRYDRVNSHDVYDHDNEPKPSSGHSHGTKCAGVALSTRNNICTVGVAYEASLQAIRLIGDYGVTDAGESQAFGHEAAMISSNSWGGREGTSFDGPAKTVHQTLQHGTSKFRNGKGTIYLFAAGNGGVDDNCNCDGYVNSIYTIGISSVGRALEPPGYAEPCSAILASAFSGAGRSSDNVCTTDVGGGCISSFSGTSAATPMAAGIIALVLEANPNLTWRDVQEIIVRTSDTTGLKYGSFKTNAVGRKVSDFFGYGLLNAMKMTKYAKTWRTLPNQHTCMTALNKTSQIIKSAEDMRSVSSIIFTNGCNDTNVCVNSIEHVQVTINFQYSKRGAVTFTLQSPLGSASKLLTTRKGDTASGSLTWTFMSVQHWGESTEGTWNLTMSLSSDYYSSGALITWRLVFHGTGLGCTNTNTTCQLCTAGEPILPLVPTTPPPLTGTGPFPIKYIIIIVIVIIFVGFIIICICLRQYTREKVSSSDDFKKTVPSISRSA